MFFKTWLLSSLVVAVLQFIVTVSLSIYAFWRYYDSPNPFTAIAEFLMFPMILLLPKVHGLGAIALLLAFNSLIWGIVVGGVVALLQQHLTNRSSCQAARRAAGP